ncbi:hypothetical protein CLAFUW4_01490 [Fulvia fulva]|uniref:Tudor domain-containing protein n=1 Tax=Passalora fulva TaxID=5499 RepID=A0A9Q8P305_PASFU|nr:uncharacterized protein CLAFUR5_01492 [Fulvia fulva]KAK4636076.1 hypothetical protein CLAFUR4_01491 [Fulvia fulva]KAK4637541.1 hypothetical protein CLAFUR0_01492 [Fulvia fulva]UJO11490.1 hypothetical protein CLAFUR5_01492 [Fulvia fulva]WPV08611.1 hypothetical protein CLAFUW4_01490 [Fulvia fulva]WPV24787.1 hypothetical protein CLAFUW7_01495 [Fulvia fulva]
MTVSALQQELAATQDDLDVIKGALDLDPSDTDALEMEPVLEEQLADLKQRLAAATKSEQSAPPPPTGDAPKYDMSKHPKFRKVDSEAPPPPPEQRKAVMFNSGDSVMAKYSADKQWYAATVLSKTGSSADPVYTVKFTGYAETETKRKHEVRAVENRKRKADAPPAAAAAPPTPVSPEAVQNGAVISAAPSVDPSLVQKREPSKVSDGPTRMAPAPKKLKGNKTLEKAKTSWNDWQRSGPKKPALGAAGKLGKDSQFRTPDLPNAKVGFTGSGKPMSKDQVRKKWNYAAGDDAED